MRPADRWLSIPMAVLVIATTSPAWSREKPARHAARQHSRSDASTPGQSGPAARQTLKEPFTAEEKRRFQAPTGQEVDRW
jgi:hypothetical protein